MRNRIGFTRLDLTDVRCYGRHHTEGKKDVVRFLVERGADVHICGCHYTPHRVELSPYCVAKLTGRGAVANYLQVNGARVDIHTAAYLGDYKSVFRLLDADPSLLKVACHDGRLRNR